jgi:hypothetical protein
MLRRPFWIPGVLAEALFIVASGWMHPPEMMFPGDAGTPPAMPLAAVLFMSAVGVAFAYWCPIARARFFLGNSNGLPGATFLLSRPWVCLLGTLLLGGALGGLGLSAFIDFRYAWLALMQSLVAAVFIFSASRRFRRHPASEWVWPPLYYLFRKLFRSRL